MEMRVAQGRIINSDFECLGLRWKNDDFVLIRQLSSAVSTGVHFAISTCSFSKPPGYSLQLTRDEYHQPVHTLPTVDSDIIEMVFIDAQ